MQWPPVSAIPSSYSLYPEAGENHMHATMIKHTHTQSQDCYYTVTYIRLCVHAGIVKGRHKQIISRPAVAFTFSMQGIETLALSVISVNIYSNITNENRIT